MKQNVPQFNRRCNIRIFVGCVLTRFDLLWCVVGMGNVYIVSDIWKDIIVGATAAKKDEKVKVPALGDEELTASVGCRCA